MTNLMRFFTENQGTALVYRLDYSDFYEADYYTFQAVTRWLTSIGWTVHSEISAEELDNFIYRCHAIIIVGRIDGTSVQKYKDMAYSNHIPIAHYNMLNGIDTTAFDLSAPFEFPEDGTPPALAKVATKIFANVPKCETYCTEETAFNNAIQPLLSNGLEMRYLIVVLMEYVSIVLDLDCILKDNGGQQVMNDLKDIRHFLESVSQILTKHKW